MAFASSRRTFRSERTANFTESVIREMTRLALEHDAVNLAQGYPDFAAPVDLKRAAIEAVEADYNQYSITWGAKPFRDAIAAKYARTYGLEIDPEREITVTCGATEGMVTSLLAVANPGDEVIVFEPFYENYHPDTLLCGAERRLVRLQPPDWRFDPDELRRAFSPRTKAIIINTPHNPTGKVFTREELTLIASLCQEFDALAITDEIYEHIVYDGHRHVPIITLPGMRDRTILLNSMSKTFAVTGWRVGWAIAAPELSTSIRKVHDFLTVNAPTPLQQAGILALNLGDDYFNGLSGEYAGRRRYAIDMLEKAGFRCFAPAGAYYVMTDISGFGAKDDVSFARHLVETVGVAGVPGSSFCQNGTLGSVQIRFCFCKKYETLAVAGQRLSQISRPSAQLNTGIALGTSGGDHNDAGLSGYGNDRSGIG
jgi:aminotransferase